MGSLFGGAGTVFATFVGALILTLVLSGMNLLAVKANRQPPVTGVIIVLVVWLDMPQGETDSTLQGPMTLQGPIKKSGRQN